MPEKSPANEKEPISYERALEAAKLLHDAKVKDPLSGEYEDPTLQSAWEIIEQWAHQNDLQRVGGYTAQKANDRVLYETIFITAGYTGPDILHAIERGLRDELAAAMNEGSEDGANILRGALYDIQAKLEAADPREHIPTVIEGKFKEAEKEIAEGKLLSAIGTLYDMLTNKQFADHLTDEQRERYLDLMNETSRRAKCPVDENFKGFPKNWKKK